EFVLRLHGWADAPGELSLWDPSGRLIFHEKLVPQNGRLEIKRILASGVYQLVWRTASGRQSTKITIVN
ncbi:MAG: hypothetical protein RMM53_04975, partial [Bacteroidia bacterium]|nr:hypothetical protein [Bacteroidia bacterium]